MELPVESFLRAIEGDPDLFAFTAGGKALTDESVQVEENGDLIIEGYAAVWEGDDREGENFAPGAFSRAAKSFVDAGGPLCFHHKRDHVLGKVTDLEEDDKGLRMRARVDGAVAKHPTLGVIYEQVKKGTLKGLSVQGFFKRALLAGKRKITDVDFTEISVTGVPMHTGPSFAVVAGKALVDDVTIPEVPQVDGEVRDQDLEAVNYLLIELEGLFNRISESVAKRQNPTPGNAE
jgi:HK97 family phage prohead protease